MASTRFLRRGGIALGAATGLLFTMAPLASAGAPSLQVDPTSGPVNTVIDVSAPGCSTGTVTVYLNAGWDGMPGDITTKIADAPGLQDDDLAGWSAQITVPATASLGDHTVSARCYSAPSLRAMPNAQLPYYNYGPIRFEVTGAPTTVTTLATTTTVAATTTTAPAPAAAAVRATPTYTG